MFPTKARRRRSPMWSAAMWCSRLSRCRRHRRSFAPARSPALRSPRRSGCRTIPICQRSRSSGYPDLVSSTWFSISGPAKLPKDIVDKLNREIAAAMAKPEVQARMRRDGLLTEAMTPGGVHGIRRSRKRALGAADPAHGFGGEGALAPSARPRASGDPVEKKFLDSRFRGNERRIEPVLLQLIFDLVERRAAAFLVELAARCAADAEPADDLAARP